MSLRIKQRIQQDKQRSAKGFFHELALGDLGRSHACGMRLSYCAVARKHFGKLRAAEKSLKSEERRKVKTTGKANLTTLALMSAQHLLDAVLITQEI